MGNKLLFNNHFSTICDFFSSSNNWIYIISPFINVTTLTEILSGVTHNHVIILTSWRKEHLLSGVSTLDIYPICVKKKWTLYVNDRVHAKIYSDGLRSGYIGSSNCTDLGLRDHKSSNIECLTFVQDFDFFDRSTINGILLSSTFVDDKIYSKYSEWIKDKKIIKNIFIDGQMYIGQCLLTSYLPAMPSPLALWDVMTSPLSNNEDVQRRAEHDIGLFKIDTSIKDYNEYIHNLRINFFSNPFVKKFEENMKDEIYFGEASHWVHNNCEDDPAPYRKEVKNLVQNLFDWFVSLDSEQYSIHIPGRHSQSLRRKISTNGDVRYLD